MIVDTSALVAILHGEPDGEKLLQRLVAAPRRAISTTNDFAQTDPATR